MAFNYDPNTKNIELKDGEMKDWFDVNAADTLFKIEENKAGTEVLKMVFHTSGQEALFHLRWN